MVTILLGMLPGVAVADVVEHSDCSPVTTDAVLSSDVVCGSDVRLSIVPGVVLDLDGHTVFGRVSVAPHATVRNGIVEGSSTTELDPFFACINLGAASTMQKVEVHHCREAVRSFFIDSGARVQESFSGTTSAS